MERSDIPIADFLLIAAAAFILGGCGESTPPPLAAQEAVQQTPEQEFAELQKKAEAGDAGAQSSLGEMYANGKGVPKDAAKAVEWFQKAAAQGFAGAQARLGWMYQNGEGVPEDRAKAVEWSKPPSRGMRRRSATLG